MNKDLHLLLSKANDNKIHLLLNKVNDNKVNKFLKYDDKINNIIDYNEDEFKNILINRISNMMINLPLLYDNNISKDDNTSINEYLTLKLNKLKEIIINKNVTCCNLNLINDYLISLDDVIYENVNKQKCNILDLYLKYSSIIHLISLIYNKDLIGITKQKSMFSNSSLIIDDQFLFTRCTASVNIMNFLLSGNDSWIVKEETDINSLNKLFNYTSKLNIEYYFIISIYPSWKIKNSYKSTLSHVFIIIKKKNKENNGKDFILIQSYYYKYRATFKEYTITEILELLKDIESILISTSVDNDKWTINDNNIWKKYFIADESELIGKTEFHGKFIKVPIYKKLEKYNIFRFNIGRINNENCYKNIITMLNKTRTNIYNTFDILCENIVYLLTKEDNKIIRSKFIELIKDNTFIIINDNNTLSANSGLSSLINKNTNSIEWKEFYLNIKNTSIDLIFDEFNVYNFKEFKLFLEILVIFFDLELEIKINNYCREHNCSLPKESYKEKYLNFKKIFNK